MSEGPIKAWRDGHKPARIEPVALKREDVLVLAAWPDVRWRIVDIPRVPIESDVVTLERLGPRPEHIPRRTRRWVHQLTGTSNPKEQ